MTKTASNWRADPLAWGHGPRLFEVFLEPTCPYSNKAFGKLDETLATAGPDKVTIKLRLQSQPWHMYSGVIVRCILAASTLPAGKDAARIAKNSSSPNTAAVPIWARRRMTSSHASRPTAA